MRYCHFVNNNKTKRRITAIHALAILTLLYLMAGLYILIWGVTHDERDILFYVFFIMIIISGTVVSRQLFWYLCRFEFLDEGLLIRGVFGERIFRWDSIIEYGLFIVYFSGRSPDPLPYYGFILSSSNEVKKAVYS